MSEFETRRRPANEFAPDNDAPSAYADKPRAFCRRRATSCPVSRGFNRRTHDQFEFAGRLAGANPDIRWITRLALLLCLIACPAGPCIAGSAHRQPASGIHFTTRLLRLDYDLKVGLWNCRWTGGADVRGASCSARLADGVVLTPAEYTRHVCGPADHTVSTDVFGKVEKIVVHHWADGKPELRQTLSIYPNRAWFVVGLEVVSPNSIASNDLAPLVVDGARTSGAGLRLDAGEKPRALFVPFDNDNYVRYNSDYASNSSEVTAIYDNASRHGFVVGSITHDLWKTGMEMKEFGSRSLGFLRAYGGATGQWTHDSQPHGMVSGKILASPKILIGCFPDWRDGMEAYAAANAKLQPPVTWNGPTPTGWNSWYAYGTKVDRERFLKVADLFKERIQPAGFGKPSSVFIDFDSYWDNLSEAQLIETVRHLHASGQKAGIYWTPFTYWGDDLERPVPGTDGRFKFRDILLKDAKGALLPKLDDGHPVDPTHVGTTQWIDWNLERFVRWRFDLIKLDFINAGALEGMHHDPAITTGIGAYNAGMKRIVADLAPAKIGRPFFISLSIAPLFPGGCAHSRRISCDVGSDLNATGYMLNSLTYGWWAAGTLYASNDPDMFRLSANEHEARTRINSCVITGGPLLDSDDLTMPELAQRAESLLAHPAVLALASSGRSFRPVEGDSGAQAADVFLRDDKEKGFLVAAFNYDSSLGRSLRLDLRRLGLRGAVRYDVVDLWTNDRFSAQDVVLVKLGPGESRILRFDR